MSQRPLKQAAMLAIFAIATQLHGGELAPSLREAERLYQSGRFEEAAEQAGQIYRFFPDDFQTLLVLGMSDFHAGNYLKASDWFRLAARKSARHPIVVRYTELLREIEYRTGPFSKDPDRRNMADDKTTAEFYKRGFFGPSFAVTSGQDNAWAQAAPLEPVLLKTPLPASASIPEGAEEHPPSQLALPLPYPSMDSILSAESMAEIAERAFESGEYQKSYLFFSQLVASAPQNRRYLIGKADAAFHMKRYRQVIDILGPLVAAGSAVTFSEQQHQKVQQLMEQSRKLVFSSPGH